MGQRMRCVGSGSLLISKMLWASKGAAHGVEKPTSERRGREEVSHFTCIERKCLIAASP